MRVRSQIRFLIVLGLGTFAGSSSFAGDWGTMAEDRALWPARLRSLTLPGGAVFDANHTITFGAWEVRFGNPPPLIRHIPVINGVGEFGGYGLRFGSTCHNASVGGWACEFYLANWEAQGEGRQCFLSPPTQVSSTETEMPRLNIPCPTDLQIDY